MDIREAARGLKYLRVLLWGASACVLTFPPWSESSFQALLLCDILWAAPLAVGTLVLGRTVAGRLFSSAGGAARAILLTNIGMTAILLLLRFSAQRLRWVDTYLFFCPFHLFSLTGVVLVCFAIRGLCGKLDLAAQFSEWTTTLYLVAVFLIMPALARLVVIGSGLDRGMSDLSVNAALWAPVPLAAVAAASIMYSTHNTIRTIMFFKREEEKEAESGGGQARAEDD